MIEEKLLARILDLAVEIQQIPAPTFDERARAEFVQNQFEAQGLLDVSVDELGNVFSRFPGSGSAPPLIVTAHLDTVFPASTPLRARREGERIYGPGIGDNALGIAGLFGLYWMIKENYSARSVVSTAQRSDLPGDLWFIANTGEEGLGNLAGMRAVVDRFQDKVTAYLVLEGMALGQVYHRALGVKRYRISANTTGGHAWVDFGRPSAIHELARLVVSLDEINLPQKPRSTLNIGIIHGGTSINTIAADAYLELDLRSEGPEELETLVGIVNDRISQARRTEVEFSLEAIGQRPAGELPEKHPLVQLAKRCLLTQGIQPNFTIGSTDANVPLSRGFPSICLGLSTGYGAHTKDEYINTRPLAFGIQQIVAFVEGVFSTL
jgi:tripeptide aminopeptidase